MKQNASIDASFWINSCAANVIEFVVHYFSLLVTPAVAEEIRYPLTVLGITSRSPIIFNPWVTEGIIKIETGKLSFDWFQAVKTAQLPSQWSTTIGYSWTTPIRIIERKR